MIAETTTGRTDRTIISGAHLDSVPEGPGINDDGSGTATQIELALQMAKLGVKPVNQVRFIWFSGEEQGLFGSTYYADQLTKTQRANTAAMLDFDMLASPNYALQIYDGDGSEFGVSGPNGSGIVESVFQKFYRRARLYTERIAFDGRSDYDEFTKVGIPAGGIAAGAEVHKTPFQQIQVGRHRLRRPRGPVRPVLPPRLRLLRDQRAPGQHQRHGARHQLRRRGALRPDLRDDDLVDERHGQGEQQRHEVRLLRVEGQPPPPLARTGIRPGATAPGRPTRSVRPG